MSTPVTNLLKKYTKEKKSKDPISLEKLVTQLQEDLITFGKKNEKELLVIYLRRAYELGKENGKSTIK